MNLKKLFIGLSLFVVAGTLVSCGDNTSTSDKSPQPIEHYFSDKVSFANLGITIQNSNNEFKTGFMKDKVAKLDLKNITDGDTAVFHLSNGEQDSFTNPLGRSYAYITVRYLAIDTPESTSSVEAWGKEASNYGKSLLKDAEGIIVDATSIDTSIYEAESDYSITDTYKSGIRLDSAGTRWLGLIWYCPKGGNPEDLTQYRSYQLDMIEECYTFNTASSLGSNYVYFADKKTEPELYEKYKDTYGSLTLGDVFIEADLRASKKNQRFTGYQIDENFDYSRKPTDYSITEAVNDFDNLSRQGKFVRLKGVVTSFIGTNFYFQDENGTPLYVYMGISADGSFLKFVKVGDTIKISGRLCEYGGQKQLSGVKWNSKDTFEKITNDEDKISMPTPIELTATQQADKDELDKVLGKLVKVKLTVSSSSPVGNQSKDKSFTLNSNQKITNLGGQYNYLNVRINGTLAPGYDYEEASTWGGKTFTCTAIMGIYLELDYKEPESYPSYQLVVGNRKISEEGTTLTDIVFED